MPFRDYSVFDEKTLKAMGAAYDAAIAKLGIDANHPMTSNVAARIAALVSEGNTIQLSSAKKLWLDYTHPR